MTVEFEKIKLEFDRITLEGDQEKSHSFLIKTLKSNEKNDKLNKFEFSWLSLQVCESLLNLNKTTEVSNYIKNIINDEQYLRFSIKHLNKVKEIDINKAKEIYSNIIKKLKNKNVDNLYFELRLLSKIATEYQLIDKKVTKFGSINNNSSLYVNGVNRIFPEKKQNYTGGIPERLENLSKNGNIVSPTISINHLKNIYILNYCNSLYVLDEHMNPIPELCSESLPLLNEINISDFNINDEIKDTSVLIADFFKGNTYGHWIMDWLSRLAFYDEFNLNFNRIVCKSFDKKFQEESIKSIGYDIDNICSLNNNSLTFFKDIYISDNCFQKDWVHVCQGGHPIVLNWWKKIKSNILTNNNNNEDKNLNLFIPRKNSRKLVNSDECYEILKNYGFIIFEPENYSFEEQVLFFNNASTIIGNHGAALTNILFMDQGTVLELFSPEWGTEAYSLLSDLNNISYHSYCHSLIHGKNKKFNSECYVDIDYLEQWCIQNIGK